MERAFYEVVRALRKQRNDTPIIRRSTVQGGEKKGEKSQEMRGIRSGNGGGGGKQPKRCVIL